ncbi:MAG: hypothetical protein GC162_11660 [Planctomycetes bacterium]|nr:hypothetical protein [Planctomycetota bacterium]
MKRPFVRILAALMAVLTLGSLTRADETADSAVWLLKKATLVHLNGMHNVLLRSLRQMRDPKLKPLFSELVTKQHPVMQIHGILGLGELDPAHHIDLALLADLKDAATQAQLVSSAIDGDLLDLPQAKQLMTWPGLSEPVKVIVASYLVSRNEPLESTAVLDKALSSDNLAMKGMAAMLKMQLGDAGAEKALDEIDKGDATAKLPVEAMLLQTAIRNKFDKVGPFAMRLTQQKDIDEGLGLLTLRTAIMFKVPGAAELWAKRFNATTSVADRIRLAILMVDLADKVDASTFKPMDGDALPLIQQIGKVGAAIAQGQPADKEVLGLLQQNNLLAIQWVIQYAQRLDIEAAKPILVGIILNAEAPPNEVRFRGERLEGVVFATEQMSEKAKDIKPVIEALMAKVPALTQEAMIMGLVRSDAPEPQKLIEGMTSFKSDAGESLALLLRAKHGLPMNDADMERLRLLVRGGAGLQDPLRVQAAWTYVKLTDQDKVTLANVLSR